MTPAIRLLCAERELAAISASLHELTRRQVALTQEAREIRCGLSAADDAVYRALKEGVSV